MWRCADPAHCIWADWDDLGVIYHRASGKTHFINAATAFLLEELAARPLTVDAAAQALAAAQESALSDEFRAEVEGTLLRLEELGLIDGA